MPARYIAVEGFGKVGTGAARYAAKLGAKVVAVSTMRGAIYAEKGLDVIKLIELRQSVGDDLVLKYDKAKKISKEDLYFLPVDILVPGSRPWVIHEKNAAKVQAKLISSGANIPITEEAEEKLFQRGVAVIPAYLSNSGGVLSSQYGGINVHADNAFVGIRKILRDNVFDLLKGASKEKISPT